MGRVQRAPDRGMRAEAAGEGRRLRQRREALPTRWGPAAARSFRGSSD